MIQGQYLVRSNTPLTKSMMQLSLEGDTSAIKAPGQFVNIKLDGFYLRRPLSICDWNENRITLLYKIVGDGTAELARAVPGDRLDVLTGLGNGYDLAKSGDRPLLIGGGVGVPPLYGLAKRLTAQGKDVTVILGFNRATECFYAPEFAALGARVIVATADGSAGVRGFVTDAMAGLDYSYFYTCGPEPMLRAVDRIARTSGQFSFEARMACGFGACMGCSCRTKFKTKRICADGPVLEREELQWQTPT